MSVSKETADQISRAYKDGLSSREVGKMFAISKTTVMKIVNNKHWSDN